MLNFKVWIWVVVIFLSAAVFRLTALDLIEFKLDEARDVYEMELFWQNPTLLERGTIQSTGVYNPPLWYYFLSVISAPSRDPQYLSFMIALINCVAVAGFYLVARRFYGQGVALASSLLLAFSPWNILMSRKIWAPDMILPLLVPLFFFLNKLILEKDKKSILGVVVFALLLAQLHASGVFLTITVIIIITCITVIQRTKVNFKYALLGLILGLIPLLPYINYQIKTGCEDCRNYSAYQEGEAAAVPFFDGNAFLRPFQFVNGAGWDNVLGNDGFRDFKERNPLVGMFNFVFLIEFLLLPVGVFYIWKQRREWWSLVGLLILIPVIYFLTKTPSHLYYFLIISPITILIYTFGIFYLGGKAHLEGVRAHLPGVTLIAIIIIINIIFEIMFYKYLSETKVIPGDYGATFSVVKEMAGERRGLERAEYWVGLFSNPNF